MIALVDYGIGNLRSVGKALAAIGAEVHITNHPAEVLAAEKVVLPGVGAFGDGMARLRQLGLDSAILALVCRGTPILGICLGMQLLFEQSEEMGTHSGLGLLKGSVLRFSLSSVKVPQTGWNQVHIGRPSTLLQDLADGSYAYFNHSYYCQPVDPASTVAETEYGDRYASVVACGNIYGVQFHPEKSQSVGLLILRNFVERCS